MQPVGRRRPLRSSATGSPASSAAATGLTRSGLAIRQPGGGSSSAKPSRRSPAVVIAAMPPSQRSAMRAGERVGAVMPAEQRHRDRAVLGQRDDRRLGPLVVEQRRQRRGSGCRWRTGRRSACRRRTAAASSGTAGRRFVPIARLRRAGRRAARRGSIAQTRRPSAAPLGPSTTTAAPAGSGALIAGRPPAMHQHHREIGHARRIDRGERQHALARQAGALDIDRAVEQAEPVEDPPHLREMPAELDDRGGLGLRRAGAASASSASLAGMTVSARRAATSGTAAAAAQAVSDETPGTIVDRVARRRAGQRYR